MAKFPNERVALLAKALQIFLEKELKCGITVKSKTTRAGNVIITCKKSWTLGGVVFCAVFLSSLDVNERATLASDMSQQDNEIVTSFNGHEILFKINEIHEIIQVHYPHAKVRRNEAIAHAYIFSS